MDPKKNPKADLAKNSALYFAIGLCLVLFLSWKLVEHKTYEKSSIDIGMLTVNEDEIEDVPLTEQLKTPPPPPPPAVVTQVLEVVKDEEDVEETVIESTETTQ
jgi:protein TonB